MLGALASEIAEVLDRHLRSHPSQTDSAAAALNVIGFYEGCSNGALSRALKLSHTATVRLVDKLEAAGLVESRPAADRRAVALHLTEAGRLQVRVTLQERCSVLTAIVDVLTPEQQDQLTTLAETLLRAMTKSAEEADHICRLCDETICPQDACPVHQAATARSA